MKIPSFFKARTLRSLAFWIGTAAILIFQAPDLALAQCSLCRDAVASSSPETREAMNHAIIGLALTPYGVAALAAWALSPAVRHVVRSRMKRLRALTKRGDR